MNIYFLNRLTKHKRADDRTKKIFSPSLPLLLFWFSFLFFENIRLFHLIFTPRIGAYSA